MCACCAYIVDIPVCSNLLCVHALRGGHSCVQYSLLGRPDTWACKSILKRGDYRFGIVRRIDLLEFRL